MYSTGSCMWSPIPKKRHITVVEALKRIKAPKPYTVSTDRGKEFLNPEMENT